jgi:ketosteroid isomerase-like protein
MRILASVVLLVCLGTSLVYSQGSDPGAESKILALERVAKLQAFQAKDLKTLEEMLDAGFVCIDPEGRLRTKSEVLAYIQAVSSLQFQLDAMDVRLHGDTAIVTGLYRMKGVDRGIPFAGQGRFVDTWLYKNGRWVAIAGLSTPNED